VSGLQQAYSVPLHLQACHRQHKYLRVVKPIRNLTKLHTLRADSADVVLILLILLALDMIFNPFSDQDGDGTYHFGTG
jgi:hypothetical protein